MAKQVDEIYEVVTSLEKAFFIPAQCISCLFKYKREYNINESIEDVLLKTLNIDIRTIQSIIHKLGKKINLEHNLI